MANDCSKHFKKCLLLTCWSHDKLCSSKVHLWKAMKFLVPCVIPNHMLSSATTRYMDKNTFHLFFFVLSKPMMSLLVSLKFRISTTALFS